MKSHCEYVSYIKYIDMCVLPLIGVVQNWTMIKLLVTVRKDDDDADDIHFALDQIIDLDYISASSLRQQSSGTQLAPIVHNILITSKPVFALTP